MSINRKKQSEIEQVLERLQLGIHSGDGLGINRLHWLGFVDFIIKNPENPKKELTHKLISVLCVKERTVQEYINCSLAWKVLVLQDGVIYYNSTYKYKNQKKLSEIGKDKEIPDSAVTKEQMLQETG